MRNFKVLVTVLVLILVGVMALPLAGISAQEELGKTMIGSDAALFHVDGGVEIWVPGAKPELWDLAIIVPADQVKCYAAIEATSKQSDSQSELRACKQPASQGLSSASTQVVTRNNLWLVARSGNIAVYRLANGGFQVNNGPQQDGKVDVVIFDEGFTYVNQYNLNPNSNNDSSGTTPVATSTPVATVAP